MSNIYWEYMKRRDKVPHGQTKWHIFTVILFLILFFLFSYILVVLDRPPGEISVIEIVLLSLAIFRLTYLFVYDEVFSFVRDLVRDIKTVEKNGELVDIKVRPGYGIKRSFFDLLNCPWCTGMWVTLVLTFLFFLTPLAWYFVLLLALAGAGTLVHVVAEILNTYSKNLKELNAQFTKKNSKDL